MSVQRYQFAIENVPISAKKHRSLKFEWDKEVIQEAIALSESNPSRSMRSIIFKVLDEVLTPSELQHKETHYQRICHRIKLMNSKD